MIYIKNSQTEKDRKVSLIEIHIRSWLINAKSELFLIYFLLFFLFFLFFFWVWSIYNPNPTQWERQNLVATSKSQSI